MFNQKFLYIMSGVVVTLVGIGLVIFLISPAVADDIFIPLITQREPDANSAGVDAKQPTTVPDVLLRPDKMPSPPPTWVPTEKDLEAERDMRENPPRPGNLPTSTPDPKFPTATPPPIPTQITQLPPRVGIPPSDKLVKYVDKNIEFSLEYPENWFVRLSTDPEPDLSLPYFITFYNYAPSRISKSSLVKGDEVNVQILSMPYQDDSKTESIEGWLRSNHHPETEFIFVSQNERKGSNEWRWIIKGGPFRFNMDAAVIVKNKRVYVITLNPANSKYKSTLERMVESFDIP